MRSVRHGISFVVGMLAVLVMGLAAVPAGATTSTWTLNDIGQKFCVPGGGTQSYLLVQVSGTWTTPLKYGVRKLPPGSSSTVGTIQPGSNDTHIINGFIGVTYAAAPVGDYHAEVWATDGKVTQTAPVLLRYGAGYACW
jgi:hypothetical protein